MLRHIWISLVSMSLLGVHLGLAQTDAPPPAADTGAPPTPPPETRAPPPETPKPNSEKEAPADTVPAGQELVNIDFPEPTEIKDIIRAVALWTGKNVILGKNVSGKVQMISPRKVTKEEAYQAFLSALNVLGLTTVETGKVIKILQVRNAVKGNLQIYQGSSWAPRTDKMITQIVPLKYINAKDIVSTLSRIVSTNSMIAYGPTNTLIISDTGYKVRRILAILELLDVQGQQPKVAIVPIRYAEAKAIANQVSEILKASTSSKSKKGGGDSYRSYKITPDERSNSVVIFGPPRTIADVKALVKKFDFPVDDPANQAAIRVRFLDYADAKKLATTLSSLAQGGGSQRRSPTIGTRSPRISRPGQPAATNTATSPTAVTADLGDNVKITADESSNALLITGSRAAYNALNNLIRKLDRRRPQVYVESDILDVNITNDFKFETSIFAGSGRADGTKVAYGWQGSKIGNVIAAQQSDSLDVAGRAVEALSTDFTVGVLSGSTVDVPGIGPVSPGALITLLKKDVNSRVISSPHLLTSNNEEAKILVGAKLFYESATQSSVVGAGAIPKIEHENVDTTLKIKPNISHSGSYVTLNIDLEANEGNIQDKKPNVNRRQTVQIVTVKNGQTAVISGLVRLTENEQFNKIPLLGDIPVIGWLFRNSVLTKAKQNLMIFITPHIVYGANDMAAIYAKKIAERDEIMGLAFDVDEDHPFMAKLPKPEDGQYRPDAYDELEQKSRESFLKEIRSDMGYTPEEMRSLDGQAQPDAGGALPVGDSREGDEAPQEAPPAQENTGDESISVPMIDPEEGGFDGGDVGVGGGDEAPPLPDDPPPEPEPPPEPMDSGE